MGNRENMGFFCTISFAQFAGIMTEARRQTRWIWKSSGIRYYLIIIIIHNLHVKTSVLKVLERNHSVVGRMDEWMNGSILIK